MVWRYRACVVDLLRMGIIMWAFITVLHVQAIPILSAYFLRHSYISHSKFVSFTCPLSFYASNDSSLRVFCVVGLFVCMLYLAAYCSLCVSVPFYYRVTGKWIPIVLCCGLKVYYGNICFWHLLFSSVQVSFANVIMYTYICHCFLLWYANSKNGGQRSLCMDGE